MLLSIHPKGDKYEKPIVDVVNKNHGVASVKKLLGMPTIQAQFNDTNDAEKAKQELEGLDEVSHVEFIRQT